MSPRESSYHHHYSEDENSLLLDGNDDVNDEEGVLYRYFAMSRLALILAAALVAARNRLNSAAASVNWDTVKYSAVLLMWVVALLAFTTSSEDTSNNTILPTFKEARDAVLGLPEWILPLWTPNNHSNNDNNNVDLNEVVDRALESGLLRERIREWVAKEIEPIKREILQSGEEKIEALKRSVMEDKERKISHLEGQIDVKLKEKANDIEDKIQGLKLQREKQQIETKTADPETESRLASLEQKLESLDAESAKCCSKTGAEFRMAAEDIVNNEKSSFTAWIRSEFMTRADAEKMSGEISADLRAELVSLAAEEIRNGARVSAEKLMANLTSKSTSASSSNSISKEDVGNIIMEALRVYDADKTGRFDFALESAGGTVVSTRCTQTHDVSMAVYSVFGIPFWYETRSSPREILRPDSSPGRCWAFKGSAGTAVIRLSSEIHIEAVTLEHISKSAAPDGKIDSAPKDFVIYGLQALDDPNPVNLGNFSYSGESSVQTFDTVKVQQRFRMVELSIANNYGNPVFTCVYRFRVHGTIA